MVGTAPMPSHFVILEKKSYQWGGGSESMRRQIHTEAPGGKVHLVRDANFNTGHLVSIVIRSIIDSISAASLCKHSILETASSKCDT